MTIGETVTIAVVIICIVVVAAGSVGVFSSTHFLENRAEEILSQHPSENVTSTLDTINSRTSLITTTFAFMSLLLLGGFIAVLLYRISKRAKI